MTTLHPVHVNYEKLHDGTYYAYAWGGGLAETVYTRDGIPTAEAALDELTRLLRPLGRRPSEDGNVPPPGA